MSWLQTGALALGILVAFNGLLVWLLAPRCELCQRRMWLGQSLTTLVTKDGQVGIHTRCRS